MKTAQRLNQARRAAGLSQRELAARAGVPQSAIARIERGQQVPQVDTFERLLQACGFELRVGPRRSEGVDRSQIREWLALSPAERARRAVGYGRALDRARTARRVGALNP
jgi:transcriptional regulator with XRE-family HTH domain